MNRVPAGRPRLLANVRLGVIGIAMLSSACSAASAPSGATPTGQPSPPAEATNTPLASIGAPATAPPSASASGTSGPLSEAEIATLTGGARVPIPESAPAPTIAAASAEATVRATYAGQRTTIGVVRIAMSLSAGIRTGWFVALTPADGEACTLHAGLLPRAIEGGVVDDQTGEIFWIFMCG